MTDQNSCPTSLSLTSAPFPIRALYAINSAVSFSNIASASFLSAFPAFRCLKQQNAHITMQIAMAATTALKIPTFAPCERLLKRWDMLSGGGAFRIFRAVELPGTIWMDCEDPVVSPYLYSLPVEKSVTRTDCTNIV